MHGERASGAGTMRSEGARAPPHFAIVKGTGAHDLQQHGRHDHLAACVHIIYLILLKQDTATSASSLKKTRRQLDMT